MRRIFLPAISPGLVELEHNQAHHLRNVLRMNAGDAIAAFDAVGNMANGEVMEISPRRVSIRLGEITPPPIPRLYLTIASAVPKSNRGDWMIEKLSELGVHRFVPLITDRGSVVPEGKSRLERWNRLAIESAEQSGRSGILKIEQPVTVQKLLNSGRKDEFFWCLSTQGDSIPIHKMPNPASGWLTMLVGPEGGWSEDELSEIGRSKIEPIQLTCTILRIETAAIAAAAIILSRTIRS